MTSAIPPLLKVVSHRKLYEPVNSRKVHTGNISALGGVAIAIAFILSSCIATNDLSFGEYKYIIASLILLFFIGLKDDLLNIRAQKKLAVQFLATVIVVALGDIRILSLHGLFGVNELDYLTSISFSILFILLVINAFNLIDGVDGLASALSIIPSLALGLWFFLNGYYAYSVLSFSLAGTLCGFFIFNVFRTKEKLFMGDSGSLVIGFVVALLFVFFTNLSLSHNTFIVPASSPVFSLALLAIPIIDLLRVATIRIIERQSPFRPDKNHIHHRLLSLTNKHLSVTIILSLSTIALVASSLFIDNIIPDITIQFITTLLLVTTLSFLPSRLLDRKKARRKSVEFRY